MRSLKLLCQAFLLAICLSNVATYIIRRDYSSLCSSNITLNEPNESVQINFDVNDGTNLSTTNRLTNCTCFVIWTGSKDIHLLPYITQSESANPVVLFGDKSDIVLNIIDLSGKAFKLEMFGSKPFYLTLTPVKSAGPNPLNPCPSRYIQCGHEVCLHQQLACDGVIQCEFDETNCYETPSNYFLVLSFLGVMLSFISISLVLGLYSYLRFYRNRVFLLSAEYKPKCYGTVNGSFNSENSFLTSLNNNNQNSKSKLFYDNLKHTYDKTKNNNYK